MTTKITKTGRLPYRKLWDIDYGSLEFYPGEPEPWDDMYEYGIAETSFYILGAYLDSIHPPGSVFRSSNSFICYDPRNFNIRISPDFYVALGVDAEAITERLIYVPQEVGKPPDFVLEIASKDTARRDLEDKRDLYAQLGVSEYWRFDHTGGAFYGQALAGELLVGGRYEPLPITTEPDGIEKGYSPVLGISLAWQDEKLRFYNPETGTYLSSYTEEQEAREVERAARLAAEARVRQLEEELRRRPS